MLHHILQCMLLLTLYTQVGLQSTLTRAHAFERLRRSSSTAFKCRRRPTMAFERGGRDGIKNLALTDVSSVLTDAVDGGCTLSNAVDVQFHRRRSNVVNGIRMHANAEDSLKNSALLISVAFSPTTSMVLKRRRR